LFAAKNVKPRFPCAAFTTQYHQPVNTNFIAIHFSNADAEQQELLIAMLADIGFTGFEQEPGGLKAFIAGDEFNQAALDEVIRIIPLDHSFETIAEQNWNAQWESSFEPIIVNDVAVRANFHEPVPGARHEIIITPKMSFGTGHHATTYMMIGQMSVSDLKERTVLDFGTGTGILAILAEKMGASSVTAIDNDDWSIENAKENIISNDCHKITLQKADALSAARQYDIILANINLNVILPSLDAIKRSLKPGGLALLSGFLTSDEDQVKEALAVHQLSLRNMAQKGDWLCLSVVA
jgi:ribosomal protein L11 methyltransferase